MALSTGQVVPQQQIEHHRCGGRLLRHDLDEPSGGRIHGGHPHHVRLVLTQTLGTLDGDLFPRQLAGHNVIFLLIRVGKPSLLLIIDLIQGRFGDIHIPFLNERGGEPIEHGQNERTNLIPVHIRIGADDDFIPTESVQIEVSQILGFLDPFQLHPAAHDPKQVGDDLTFEDAVVVRLQAVQNLPPHRHNALKLRISGQLASAQCGVTFHNIQLPPRNLFGAAVHKLLHPIGQVVGGGELLFDVQARLFRRLTGTLVDEDLSGDLLRLRRILNEIDL